ncbi:LysM peptidoglycan-binding domain-containing protein, partial [Verrucomicrobiota bacterium]
MWYRNPAGGIIEYIVVSGDSLSMIAKRNKVSTRELQELNKLTDPNKIRIGQKLIIPKRSFSPAAPAVKRAVAKPKKKAMVKPKPKDNEQSDTFAKPSESLATEIDEYVVQAGDSLSK